MLRRKATEAAHFRRVHVTYKGRVQGVGFRYTVERVALETGITGWVRNLPNGDVELVAEGADGVLAETLAKIKASEVGRYVRRTTTDWQEYRKEFADFRIEFAY